jgi:hypothetical protein
MHGAFISFAATVLASRFSREIWSWQSSRPLGEALEFSMATEFACEVHFAVANSLTQRVLMIRQIFSAFLPD